LTKNISLKIIGYEDINQIVGIHSRSLPEGVLPNLGKGTIARYYRKIIRSQLTEDAFIYGAYEDERLVGFCCLTKRQVEFSTIINLDTIAFILVMFFRDPTIFIKALVQFVYDSPISSSACEISYIAVEDGFRGLGIGGLLINLCMKRCSEQGILYIQTKTSNKSLQRHYMVKYGGEIINEFAVFGDVYRVIVWRT
jgi:GNAT superfamily N-acetyltransferase